MANYLTLVVTASFFCSLISSLISDKGAGKTAKSIINIVMLAVIVMPVINAMISFSNNFALPVINDTTSHIIDNKEDDIRVYREWLARTTADELSKEIEASLLDGMGISVVAQCPWHFSGDDVVFDKIQIHTKADKRSYRTIENYIKLHFSLDAVCVEAK